MKYILFCLFILISSRSMAQTPFLDSLAINKERKITEIDIVPEGIEYSSGYYMVLKITNVTNKKVVVPTKNIIGGADVTDSTGLSVRMRNFMGHPRDWGNEDFISLAPGESKVVKHYFQNFNYIKLKAGASYKAYFLYNNSFKIQGMKKETVMGTYKLPAIPFTSLF